MNEQQDLNVNTYYVQTIRGNIPLDKDDFFLEKFGVYHGEILEHDNRLAKVLGVNSGMLYIRNEGQYYAEKCCPVLHSPTTYNSLLENGYRRYKNIEKQSLTYSKLYQDTTFSDVCFLVEGKELRAHKCILASESDYFKTLFTTSIKGDEKDGKIEIKSMSYDLFSSVLRFIYLKNIIFTYENFIDLVNISEMYLMEDLKQKCIDHFETIFVDVNKFLEAIPLIKNIDFIKGVCIKYIVSLWGILIEYDSFYKMLNEDLEFQKSIYHAIDIQQVVCQNMGPSVEPCDREKIKSYLLDYSNDNAILRNDVLEILESKSLFNHANNIKIAFNDMHIPLPFWYTSKYNKHFKN